MPSLNVGSGDNETGDVRVDLYRSKFTDLICSAEALPFREKTFTRVFSTCLLEHLPNVLVALKEQERVLEPGGSLHLLTDNAGFVGFHETESVHYEKHPYRGRGPGDKHFALFTDAHVKNLLRAAGLENVDAAFAHGCFPGEIGFLLHYRERRLGCSRIEGWGTKKLTAT